MSDPIAHLSYGLSPAQTRCFLEDGLPEAKAGLNLQQIVCTTTEEIDFPKFRQAWEIVANRHIALGVAFRRDDRQQPYQRFWPPVQVAVSFEERGETGADREAFIEHWLEQDRQVRFELAHTPLMRVSAFHFADREVAWIWTFHEILMDGPSARLILDDLFSCYDALLAEQPVVLPDRRPFSDFIAWHNDRAAANQSEDRAFWERLVTNVEIDSRLSLRGPASPTAHGQQKLAFELDEATATTLVHWAKASGLSLKTVVLGAWSVLLNRHYRSASVTFGTIRLGRHDSVEGAEGMIGPLMNYLPVHADFSANPSVLDFLHGIQDQQNAARDYRWTSPDVIRSALPPAASKQLFDSCVLHQRAAPEHELKARLGADGQRSFSIRERPNIPLLLASREEPQLAFELIYQADLFDPAEIEQLTRSFVAVLNQFPARTVAKINDLELLTPGERSRGIGMLAGPTLPFPSEKGLHEWFEEQTRRTPDSLAIIAENELTYAQLDRRADALAHQLRALELAPDRLVAVFLPRSSALLVAILGTLKSGAAYLPVDVDLPSARLKTLLDEANVGAVLTESTLAPSLPSGAAPVILVEASPDETLPASDAPLTRVGGSQLAYAISTSGTTGTPKLIGVEHRQISNLLAFATRELLQAADVRWVPFIDSPSFDSSISQIFTTLALGGTLVRMADLAAVPLSPHFAKFTCLGTTPSLLAAILKNKSLPPEVRLIGLGAEAIPADLIEALAGLPQIQKVINYYGPTETTVYCTYSIVLDRADSIHAVNLRGRGRIIGRPVANARAYVVDDHGHLAPPGAPGELYIAGEAVARGYLNAPGEAAANFCTDPFQPGTAVRLYRTGDIVCLRQDGDLEFHGRKDHQLKCNGVRIEAAEIENALQAFPGIHQAVVDVRSDTGSSQRLVAYLAAETISRPDLKKALRTTLPDAMIPHHFVFLPGLPVTSNGKVDRAALARLPLEAAAPARTAAPVTSREKEMTALWERNLGRHPIGLDQDYFELGGDSLSAVNLLAAIEKQFGQKLKIAVLLDHSTIADLLAALGNPAAQTHATDFTPICEFLPIQESGDGVPLVVLAGGTGSNLVHYRNFAHKFAPDHPVYALQYPYALLLGKPENPLSLLAETIADQVLTVVTGRPFVLFGHCLGGLLAWHVAGVLQRRSAPPFRLVVYAPPAEANSTGKPPETESLSRLKRLLNAYRPAWQEWQMDHGAGWWTYLTFARLVLENFLERRGWIRTKQDPFRFVKLTYLRLIERSPLQPYPGEALVILHLEEADAAAKSLWPTLSSGVQIEYVPGHHRVWQNAILSILPLMRERLQSLAVPESKST